MEELYLIFSSKNAFFYPVSWHAELTLHVNHAGGISIDENQNSKSGSFHL